MLDLLIVMATYKRLILIVTLVFAVSAALISLILPQRFTATVTILPPQQNTSMATALASQLGNLGSMAALAGGGGGFSLKSPNDMYVGMLRSETVEDAMVRRFELMREYRSKYLSDARTAFEKHTTVDGSSKDGLIHISFEDKNPERAAEIANVYVQEFRTLTQHLAITEASQRRLFFEQQLIEAKDNLANAEQALKQTEQKTGLIQLDSQARALIESAAALRAQIAAKEVQIQAMRTYATGENPGIIQAQQELGGLQAQLSKLSGSEENGGGLIVPKGKVPEAGLEYVRKLRDVKYYETIFEILARQFEVAKLDEAKQGSVVQVVDPATLPDKRSFPKRGLITLTATAAGFFVGVCLAFVLAAIERLKSRPEVNQKLAQLEGALRTKKTSVS
ncbi:MAG TPA: GNVR domain-containing protein [Silvibacterium sp.]|nr:GNVR domain-containing protein [Silvibacterium sp.]